ncbi:putative enoyl-CoA hydratase domain-containing protein 3, mitochondrial-like [Apostichopus japonicus]|uniref:Enoyl-CoA hydratase domain-containing protein 3, mitochondrial n=1 Tax=Stichopus japonicus TaxID=307972 RepID=A0A2G8L9W0_STIJA|nr:putative enoyl-CoA hydratase domain-containing protein 3, mitochondrial-like [Apostichopus japonicus]
MAASMRISKLIWPNLAKTVNCFHQTRNLSAPAANATKQYTLMTQKDGVRRIHLNDPKKRNALSLAMLHSLKNDLLKETAGDEEEVRIIIISGEGPVFCAGHDLKELTSETGRKYHTEIFDACTDVMLLVQDMPVPVIAQVAGLATAAGCQLVASCDIAVVSEKSRFATPGVNVGLFCSTPGVALGRAVPRKIAMEMLFTGEPITAQAALQHGLVSKVVPHEQLEEETQKLAEKICQYSSSVISLGKSCFNSQMGKSRKEAYREAGQVMVDNLSLKDGQEGIGAFVRKEHPKWSNSFDKAHE